MGIARERLFEMGDEGTLDWGTIAVAALKFMSEQEIREMMELNEIGMPLEDEE